jgi:uncharacterized protein (TIGR02147 family)
MNTVDLFAYTDYRLFLRDWANVSRQRKGFSIRAFTIRAGLGSSGYFKMVIDGNRNLGLKGLERFMNGMKLVDDQRLYFRYLVLWNQAETDEERGRYEGRLALLRKCRTLMPEVLEKVHRLRDEIAGLFPSEFTKEEASLLAGQLLSSE